MLPFNMPKSPEPPQPLPDSYYKRQFLREIMVALARAGTDGAHLADALKSYGDAYDDVCDGVYDDS